MMGDLRQDVLCVTAQLNYHVDFFTYWFKCICKYSFIIKNINETLIVSFFLAKARIEKVLGNTIY